VFLARRRVLTRPRGAAIVSEFCHHGSMQDLYRKRPHELTPERLSRWVREMICGMAYLHSREPPIIHRDLKCGNLLLDAHWTLKGAAAVVAMAAVVAVAVVAVAVAVMTARLLVLTPRSGRLWHQPQRHRRDGACRGRAGRRAGRSGVSTHAAPLPPGAVRAAAADGASAWVSAWAWRRGGGRGGASACRAHLLVRAPDESGRNVRASGVCAASCVMRA
jgi:hypothetical protein